ncbi:MAG: antibiotic biosynthesis monooxygenase [Saprospiraceae bacterium]|nr:antibiotic biosynthesis monooxygenase [Saprospiraceae bacterium]
MIKRIVKMTFQADKVDTFIGIFTEKKQHIRHFPGCHHLELFRDINRPEIFFTYSYWEDEAALNAYRYSDLFKGTWADTKALFAGKPEAWSVEVLAIED